MKEGDKTKFNLSVYLIPLFESGFFQPVYRKNPVSISIFFRLMEH